MANVDVINRIFSKIDVDQSGSISKSEMDNAFKLFDKDGNGTVSSEEWLDGFVTIFDGTSEQAQKVFQKLSKSESGGISIESLYNLFTEMDSDGQYPLQECRVACQQKCTRPKHIGLSLISETAVLKKHIRDLGAKKATEMYRKKNFKIFGQRYWHEHGKDTQELEH